VLLLLLQVLRLCLPLLLQYLSELTEKVSHARFVPLP
jgi:hypothetical protein